MSGQVVYRFKIDTDPTIVAWCDEGWQGGPGPLAYAIDPASGDLFIALNGSSRTTSQAPGGRGGAAGAAEPARSSGIPAAQKLWHVSKAHLLELSEEGFWRRAAVQPATLAAL